MDGYKNRKANMSSFKPTKVTERVFAQIKDDLAADHTEPWIREVYGVGLTTMRLIKKCKNYDAYNSAPPAHKGCRYCKNRIHENRTSDVAEKGTEGWVQKAEDKPGHKLKPQRIFS